MSTIVDPGHKTAHALRAGEFGAVIREAADGGVELVNLRWGLRPRGEGDRPLTLLRSEGRRFEGNRCLIPRSEFFFSKGRTRYRFTLASGDWFFFAGVWRAGSADWPESYALITVAANPEVAPYHDRQVAVIRIEDRMKWLDPSGGEELLRPLPQGSFLVEAVSGPKAGQRMFGW